jgi:CheY-like chemotaxis protein
MKRVLIVDDALDLGRMLRIALETLDTDLEIQVVPSAEEALLEISRQPAELLITDIRLPGMSGFDLLDKVRARSPYTRSILMTAMTEEKVLKQARSSDADRFMRKPIQVNEFLLIACELLELPPTVMVTPEHPPAAAQPAAPAAPPAEDLPGILARIRRELGAPLVLLADEMGKPLAQAGELPGLDFEKRWAVPIMSALNASLKVSRLLQGGLPQAALAFRASPLSLVMAPVGDYALVAFLHSDPSGLRTAICQEVLLQAQKDLAVILGGVGARFQSITDSLPVDSVDQEPGAEAIEFVESDSPSESDASLNNLARFLQKSTGKLDSSKVEDFWDGAVPSESVLPDDPDVLSYDQARQLGLTPEEDEGKR